eukprot:13237893-Ditylum_brightwellii.AAC.1
MCMSVGGAGMGGPGSRSGTQQSSSLKRIPCGTDMNQAHGQDTGTSTQPHKGYGKQVSLQQC